MSVPALATRLCGMTLLGTILAMPAHAEGNRLLPFWGQPYPYGYAWAREEPQPYRAAVAPCRGRHDVGRRHGGAHRCEVVLHARD